MIPTPIALLPEEMETLSRLFNHPAGEEALLLIERKFCNIRCFDTDPYQHAYNAGKRGLALLLCAAANNKVQVVGTEHIDPNDSDNIIE